MRRTYTMEAIALFITTVAAGPACDAPSRHATPGRTPVSPASTSSSPSKTPPKTPSQPSSQVGGAGTTAAGVGGRAARRECELTTAGCEGLPPDPETYATPCKAAGDCVALTDGIASCVPAVLVRGRAEEYRQAVRAWLAEDPSRAKWMASSCSPSNSIAPQINCLAGKCTAQRSENNDALFSLLGDKSEPSAAGSAASPEVAAVVSGVPWNDGTRRGVVRIVVRDVVSSSHTWMDTRLEWIEMRELTDQAALEEVVTGRCAVDELGYGSMLISAQRSDRKGFTVETVSSHGCGAPMVSTIVPTSIGRYEIASRPKLPGAAVVDGACEVVACETRGEHYHCVRYTEEGVATSAGQYSLCDVDQSDGSPTCQKRIPADRELEYFEAGPPGFLWLSDLVALVPDGVIHTLAPGEERECRYVLGVLREPSEDPGCVR